MGAWGHHAFQNDESGDFVDALEQEGVPAIDSALDFVIKTDGYLEADRCQCAIAAAETLCILLGRAGPSIPEEITAWAGQQEASVADLIPKAKKSLERILRESELNELWRESPDYEAWKTSVADVMKRLG